jgi:8-oxo-dGTP pyrophosphatase MutT (NUDIX family)
MVHQFDLPPNAASVALLRGGQVLLIQRARAPWEGAWSLPGGRLEPGETAEDCAARELQEELGLLVAELRPVARLVLGESRFRLQEFGTEVFDGDVVPNDEIAAWQWVRRGEETGLSTTPHLSEVLGQAFGLFDRS